MNKTKTSNTKPIKPKKPVYKIVIDWALGIFVALLIGVVGVFAVANFTSNKNETHGLTYIFDYSYLLVLTDSMEPDYEVGSCVIIQKINQEDVKVGDDLTFYYEPYNMVVTHRVEEIIIKENEPYYTFKLHGINKTSDQCKDNGGYEDCTTQYQVVTSDKVLGKVVSSSFALGQFLNFMLTPWGLIILLLIPGGYLIYVSASNLIKAFKEEPNESEAKANKTPSSIEGISEEDKERLKKELLNEMLEGLENEKSKKMDA